MHTGKRPLDRSPRPPGNRRKGLTLHASSAHCTSLLACARQPMPSGSTPGARSCSVRLSSSSCAYSAGFIQGARFRLVFVASLTARISSTRPRAQLPRSPAIPRDARECSRPACGSRARLTPPPPCVLVVVATLHRSASGALSITPRDAAAAVAHSHRPLHVQQHACAVRGASIRPLPMV